MGRAGRKKSFYKQRIIDRGELKRLEDICNSMYNEGWGIDKAFGMPANQIVLLFKRLPDNKLNMDQNVIKSKKGTHDGKNL